MTATTLTAETLAAELIAGTASLADALAAVDAEAATIPPYTLPFGKGTLRDPHEIARQAKGRIARRVRDARKAAEDITDEECERIERMMARANAGGRIPLLLTGQIDQSPIRALEWRRKSERLLARCLRTAMTGRN